MSSQERNSPPPEMSRRRGSVTQATLSTLFQRSSSISAGGTAPFPGPIATAAMNDQRRRLSLSTAVGLSGTSPTSAASFLRRGSLSTNASEAIDENAIDEEDGPPRTAPPYQRRFSFGNSSSMRYPRGPTTPGANDQGFNWTEQLRSRAESLTTATRPAFTMSTSPPRGPAPVHERSKSVAEMPHPPAQAASIRPQREAPRKPDPFQERILKGDFYMD